MALPIATRQLDLFDNGDARSSREDALARYRLLREINKRLHEEILGLVSRDALVRQARRLGLAQGKTIVLESYDELNYVNDLAIYTAPGDRTRAVDRYARSARFEAQSDEALMLEAMRTSHFFVLVIEGRHETAGLIATDAIRGSKVWLVDIGLEMSMQEGEVIATRLLTPGPFSMTAGAIVLLEPEMLDQAFDLLPHGLGDGELAAVVDDRRFAEALYTVALADGMIHRMRYLNPPDND